MSRRISWNLCSLSILAEQWYRTMRGRKRSASDKSDWWLFAFSWSKTVANRLNDFTMGRYRFSPMREFYVDGRYICVWSYCDRLILHLLLKIIRPCFRHLISSYCFHLQGPAGIRMALTHLQQPVQSSSYSYVMRLDIKSYYASIRHDILLEKLCRVFCDPRVLYYLEAVVTTAVDYSGNVFLPTQGIPRCSSLSPFFGALYLSELDEALQERKGVVYARYMDDIVILIQTRRQYRKVKRILLRILHDLQLKLSPSKSYMGQLNKGFHFLGVMFAASQNLQSKTQIKIALHRRTCARALDRVRALRINAVHPAQMQRYLSRWAVWWSAQSDRLTRDGCLHAFAIHSAEREPTCAGLGRGLLLQGPVVNRASCSVPSAGTPAGHSHRSCV